MGAKLAKKHEGTTLQYTDECRLEGTTEAASKGWH